jgi:outer membrane murein-binding lipoprotein Lpp
MRYLAAALLVLMLAGCGAAEEAKDTVVAPVDNIKKNVDYLQDTRKELKNTAGKNADEANKQIDDILKKK